MEGQYTFSRSDTSDCHTFTWEAVQLIVTIAQESTSVIIELIRPGLPVGKALMHYVDAVLALERLSRGEPRAVEVWRNLPEVTWQGRPFLLPYSRKGRGGIFLVADASWPEWGPDVKQFSAVSAKLYGDDLPGIFLRRPLAPPNGA